MSLVGEECRFWVLFAPIEQVNSEKSLKASFWFIVSLFICDFLALFGSFRKKLKQMKCSHLFTLNPKLQVVSLKHSHLGQSFSRNGQKKTNFSSLDAHFSHCVFFIYIYMRTPQHFPQCVTSLRDGRKI